MLYLDDTIVALSSAPGSGGRAIVRMSGPAAVALTGLVFHSATEIQSSKRGVDSGFLELRGVAAPVPAEMYLFPAPRSYTGQFVVELHLVSSPPLVEQLIADLLAAGARAAQPGEFTLRAFLAGKLDLPKAEAALAAIEASDRNELKAALHQLAGGVSRPLDGLREDLLNLLADLEAGLDFAEEDLQFVVKPQVLKRLADALAKVTLVQKQVAERALAGRPFRVAIVGPPNAGKSRLFNALTGKDALVSPMPGTTRDYLTATLIIAGVPTEIIDTAGERETSDPVEIEAQRLGQAIVDAADLILLCHDVSQGEPQNSPKTDRIRRIATKCDLGSAPDGMIPTSTASGMGLGAVRRTIAEAAGKRGDRGLAPSLSRCSSHIDACLESLRRVHKGVLLDDPPETVAADLRTALDELGGLTGAVHTDDLLDRVFSRFCIGK